MQLLSSLRCAYNHSLHCTCSMANWLPTVLSVTCYDDQLAMFSFYFMTLSETLKIHRNIPIPVFSGTFLLSFELSMSLLRTTWFSSFSSKKHGKLNRSDCFAPTEKKERNSKGAICSISRSLGAIGSIVTRLRTRSLAYRRRQLWPFFITSMADVIHLRPHPRDASPPFKPPSS